MMKVVVPGRALRKASQIFRSVFVSTAEVLSSRIRIFGRFSRARAMHRRCFWPPEKLVPPCSTQVS